MKFDDLLSKLIAPSIWIFLGSVFASFIVRATKISEFRQAWINELRDDVAAFLTKAHERNQKLTQLREQPNQTNQASNEEVVHKLGYKVEGIYRRIQLRSNPTETEHVALLSSLRALVDLNAVKPQEPVPSWKDKADTATTQACQVLKREWAITKAPIRSCVKKLFRSAKMWTAGSPTIALVEQPRRQLYLRISLVILAVISAVLFSSASVYPAYHLQVVTQRMLVTSGAKFLLFLFQIAACVNLWVKESREQRLTRLDRYQPALTLILITITFIYADLSINGFLN